MHSKRYKIAKKVISALILLTTGWHTFSVHGLGEYLIYCYESDGSVNIETICDHPIGISSEHNLHTETNYHEHEGVEYHYDSQDHFDVEITETCIKDNRTNRFDQYSALESLLFQNNQVNSYLSNSAFEQTHSFTPSNATYQSALSLKTVVLQN